MEPIKAKVEEKPKNVCPICGKDMTIRPGAIFDCDRPICAYWRLAFE